MTPRAARTLRGSAFAVLAVLLAAAGHTLAGGGAPSPLFCAVVAALSTPAAVLLAGSRVRAWRTIAAVLAGQLMFHVAFTTVGDIGRGEVGHPAATAPHVHGTDILLAPVSAAAPASIGMLLAHVAAALVAAAMVRRGERAVVAVWLWVRRLVVRIRHRVLAPQPAMPLVASTPRPVVRPTRVASEPLSRRGPPLFAAA